MSSASFSGPSDLYVAPPSNYKYRVPTPQPAQQGHCRLNGFRTSTSTEEVTPYVSFFFFPFCPLERQALIKDLHPQRHCDSTYSTLHKRGKLLMTGLLSGEERFGRDCTMLSCCQSVAKPPLNPPSPPLFPRGCKKQDGKSDTPKGQCMTQCKPSARKESI